MSVPNHLLDLDLPRVTAEYGVYRSESWPRKRRESSPSGQEELKADPNLSRLDALTNIISIPAIP